MLSVRRMYDLLNQWCTQHERHFWNCLYGVATQEQIKRILDGHKVTISDTIYQIIEEEKS